MKILKYIGISILIAGSLFAAAFFVKTNNKSAITFETEKMFKTSIEKKTVVTGKVIPEDEVEITPQIQGIIDEIYVEEGDQVNNGDLLAKIKVVPNVLHKLIISFIISKLVMESRLVVGSSAINNLGFKARAIAIETLCLIPPLN